MESHFTRIDWIVLAVYFVGTMSIGFYFWRRSRSTDGFTAAGRALPGWVVGLSIFATYLSSISYLALPGKSFATNWNPFVFSLSIPEGCVMNKMLQPDNIEYLHEGSPKHRISCCLLKQEILPTTN